MRTWPLLLIPVLAVVSQAQTAKSATTTVTGHVYCADTNAPARMATVMLEPVDLIEKAGVTAHSYGPDTQVNLTAVQTVLDGSFAIPKVAPGAYYVVAYKAGYLSPLATFPSDVLQHPSDEDRKRIAAIVPRITVEAGLPASIDLRLERGAAISGTVLFDDGSPAADLVVRALVRHKQGQKETWSPLPAIPFAMSAEAHTDDVGHYRISGLAPRDYTIQVDMELQNRDYGVSTGGSGISMYYRPVVQISFFSGDTARKRDAAPFKLGAGEERTGEDITIPLSKLHTITGELLAGHDGHVLTGGNIQLLDADDKSEIETTKVDRSDSKFHFYFIPEDSYILHVDSAADITYEDLPYPPGTMPPTHEVAHTLRTYGTLDQPLNVHDDLPSLVLSIPDKTAQQPPRAAGSQ